MCVHRFTAPILLGIGLVIGWPNLSTAYGQRQVTAIPGTPFGVAAVTVPITAGDVTDRITEASFAIDEADGRVFYPAFSNSRLRGLVDTGASGELTISFLFTGDAPLHVTVYSPAPQAIDVLPRAQAPRLFNRELTQWWRNYNAAARESATANDVPPLVQTYLTSMLGNRLGLQPPLLSRLQESKQPNEAQHALELLAGTESVRAALMREAMQASNQPFAPAEYAVPENVPWVPQVFPDLRDAPDVEPIALHVPEECFYIRFGSFENYLWLSKLTREYGGDVGRMVTLRGHDAGLNKKTERQLVLEETFLSELFGGTVIADVALIGRDLYEQDGAAIGMLFHAKNSKAIAADFQQKRVAAREANDGRGATLETVDIDGNKVSFLSTPDNHLRSFYAASGDFHLVTTSREMARRFLEISSSGDSLGNSAEFQYARYEMPTDRDDTIFAYFSTSFFRGLVTPQYQIELSRRLRATTNIQLVKLARLAASAEGKPADTIDDLVDADLLPRGFGRNADSSGPIIERDRVIDSLRGAQGTFTPIPDIELRAVTASEAERYARRASYYQQHWTPMDPLMVGMKRYALGDDNLERLVIDANISPLAEEKYGWLMSMIGPPTDVRIVTPPDELISVQASLLGSPLAPSDVPHHLFLGVRDAPPNANLQPTGAMDIVRILRETPSYVGSWPKVGIVDWLPFGLGGGEPDPSGFSRLLLGGWRWQGGDFSMLSFDREVLERTIEKVRVEPTENPAQIRVHVADLSQSQLSRWLNSQSYERAMQTSLGNAKLLQTMSQQLRVPPAEALRTTQDLLNTKLVCALDGKYELVDRGDGRLTWRSTNWPDGVQPFPEDYQAPVLVWFRGLDLDLTKHGDRLVMHAELDMKRAPDEKIKLELPLFNLFGTGNAE